MQRLGFIHDMMDVKILILFVAARSNYPMTNQEIYELCYQDECLSYFDVCTAIPEMVASGHLKEVPLPSSRERKMPFPAITASFAAAVLSKRRSFPEKTVTSRS